MSESFLGGRVFLEAGDCREVLADMPSNMFHACVTDPPYHLTSVVQRFGGANAAPVKTYKTGAYGGGFKEANGGTGAAFARMSRGFMGKTWDGGDVAFQPETWAAVYRVLKPGAHLLAFGGTRTYHRLVCAIEDAGFECRDMIAWMYGSGFPKSHDVSKGIDKRGGASISWFGPWLRCERERLGITQKSLALHFPSKSGGLTGCVANWELGLNLPTVEQFNTLCRVLDLPFSEISEAEREVVGKKAAALLAVAPGQDNERPAVTLDITAPATDLAAQWSGWGSALKPALEPICLARKPLSEPTIAANVLRWGTGALNIDGCRVGTEITVTRRNGDSGGNGAYGRDERVFERENPPGRWPANVIHDGSDEVVAAFPEAPGQQFATGPQYERNANVYGKFAGVTPASPRGDSGSAARFFYTAKADGDDRLGSRHPTVKPIDLMRWLCRLICPPGGTVLDPFAGTGTTGEAAWREGFEALLVERDAGYLDDIRRRMALALAGPEERARESIKARGRVQSPGPLFDGLLEAAE